MFPSDELETVDAQDTLISAIEVMFENEYTQLGIERDREVVGMVSYRSISRVLSILRKLGMDKEVPTRQVGVAIEEISPTVEPDDDLIILFDPLAKDPDDLDEELQDFFVDKDIRTPARITDCSFGHFPPFISQNWSQFERYFKDTEQNGDFGRCLLVEVGSIRNKIFHFRSESFDSKLEEELLRFAHGYFQNRIPETA